MNTESKGVEIRVVFPFQDIRVWQQFVVGLRRENRFTLDEEPARFVEKIIEYARAYKTVTLTADTPLYRARVNDNRDKVPHALENMGAPPSSLAGHGRLNPRGIPYLYLASDRITAVSEVRPWVRCDVTVAEFRLAHDVELVNFSQRHFVNVPKGEQFEGPELVHLAGVRYLAVQCAV
jgi:hypothetical protein